MIAAQFVGEIRPFVTETLPEGWLPCDGRLLPISGNEALFSFLYVKYGGNGIDNFALPDLRGGFPVHASHREQIEIGQSFHTAGAAVSTIAVNYFIAFQGEYSMRS